MRSTGWQCAAAIAVLWAGLATAQAQVFGGFSIGSWGGEAIFHNASFAYCAMSTRSGGWQLGYAMNHEGHFNLALTHKRLRYAKGAKVRGVIAIDGGAAGAHEFVADTKTRVILRLRKSPIVGKLAQAYRLRVALGEVAHDFTLVHTRQAFALLSSCAAKRGRK